jgi:hypothetical protein
MGRLITTTKSTGSGNCAADVFHPIGDSGSGEAWLHIDDEAVSAVRHEEVFDNERVNDGCVYMLFIVAVLLPRHDAR